MAEDSETEELPFCPSGYPVGYATFHLGRTWYGGWLHYAMDGSIIGFHLLTDTPGHVGDIVREFPSREDARKACWVDAWCYETPQP